MSIAHETLLSDIFQTANATEFDKLAKSVDAYWEASDEYDTLLLNDTAAAKLSESMK